MSGLKRDPLRYVYILILEPVLFFMVKHVMTNLKIAACLGSSSWAPDTTTRVLEERGRGSLGNGAEEAAM